MVKKKKATKIANTGETLKKQNEPLNLDQEKVKVLKETQQKEAKKIKVFRSSFHLDRDGKIKRNSIANVVNILNTDPMFKGAFKYNSFNQENEIVRDIPQLKIYAGPFEDATIDEIILYIERQSKYDHVLFDPQKIRSALTTVCRDHTYNPLINYFNIAYTSWDRKPRIKSIFNTYLGAEDSEVNKIIAIHFFSNAVAQVFEPGRHNDEVLDLVGKQGTGKTEFTRRIAPLDLYTDNFTTFTKPDDFNEFRLNFIINDDELAVSNKVSFEDVKKFASKRELTFRASYARYANTYKRRWVMVRTTNNLYYLNDLTGNRRFMPVLANKDKVKKSVFSITEEDKKQIWGEAVALYKKDLAEHKKNKEFRGILRFTKEQEKEILNTQLQFTGTSSIEDQIDLLVNATDFVNHDFIKSYDLAHQLNIDPVKDNKIMSKVSKIMINKMGFKKSKRNNARGFKRL